MSKRLIELGGATAFTAALLVSACAGDQGFKGDAGTSIKVDPPKTVEQSRIPQLFSVGFGTVEKVDCKAVISDPTGDNHKALDALQANPTLAFKADIATMFADADQYTEAMVLAGCIEFVKQYPIIELIDSSAVTMSLACVALQDDSTRCSLLDPRSTVPRF